ncbi:MAG: FecR domain-containing protein [Chitinophagaceae bacterium]|jgi:hypothetical protein|nr:FecR domain-containing protein [Chitinophagaceae bacterium]
MSDNYQFLIDAFLRAEISETDLDKLIEWLKQSDENKHEFLQLRNFYLSDLYQSNEKILQQKAGTHWLKLSSALNLNNESPLPAKTKNVSLFTKKYLLRIAVVLIPAIIITVVFWQKKNGFENKKPDENLAVANNANPVFSLRQKAVLTLSNGQTIALDSVQNKVIANDANAQLLNDKGSIIYKQNDTQNASVAYNTVATTKGGQYKLILADGTNVWLNAVSSITYPVAFQGSERTVKLNGEAYFEVAKNAKMPFKVITNNQTIEVVGTHFNVNGYANETLMNTTLVEGKVKVITNKGTLELLPGEQSQVAEDGNIRLEKNADIDQILAWRNGILSFHNAAITDITRQLERWFDVEVKVQGSFEGRKFSGEIPQSISLNKLQRLFEVNKISCSFQSNSSPQILIISPQK